MKVVRSSTSCVRNLTVYPMNDWNIISEGFLDRLIDFVDFKGDEGVPCHAAVALHSLAEKIDSNRRAIIETRAIERISVMILGQSQRVQEEALSLFHTLINKENLSYELQLKILQVALHLIDSTSEFVQFASQQIISCVTSDPLNQSNVVSNPAGGLHVYLSRYLDGETGNSITENLTRWSQKDKWPEVPPKQVLDGDRDGPSLSRELVASLANEALAKLA
ncbi:Vacuolar protein 8 [Mortierella sp. GBA30]|nr:Vacuolar protein 8 [Mortierella sp. GBA30]